MNSRRERVDVYLAPAQLGVFTTPTRVRTVLGSCVALCLWDHGNRIGGINHYPLARAPATPDGDSDLRYGTIANRILLERMRSAGAILAHLEAAVIGGGRQPETQRAARPPSHRNRRPGGVAQARHTLAGGRW